MTDDLIIVEKVNDIGKIIFNNGPLNILTIQMMEQINEALKGFLQDESLKLVIFDHNGKFFSAGVDVSDHIGEKAPKMIMKGRKAPTKSRIQLKNIHVYKREYYHNMSSTNS